MVKDMGMDSFTVRLINLIIKGCGVKELKMGKELSAFRMEGSIKVILRMDSDKEKEKWDINQVINMMDNGKGIRKKGSVWWIGILPSKNTKEIGRMMFLQVGEATSGSREN